jgi:hypothetical protein
VDRIIRSVALYSSMAKSTHLLGLILSCHTAAREGVALRSLRSKRRMTLLRLPAVQPRAHHPRTALRQTQAHHPRRALLRQVLPQVYHRRTRRQQQQVRQRKALPVVCRKVLRSALELVWDWQLAAR